MDVGDQQTQEREDGVLIEKDGRFELVSVSDMQAQEHLQQYQEMKDETVQDQGLTQQQKTIIREHDVGNPDSDLKPTKPDIKSESKVSFVLDESKSDQNTQVASTPGLVPNSRYKLFVKRTKSAPGFREGRQPSEEDKLKRERNEVAFRAWLARKNKEFAEQKQVELSKSKKSEDKLKEKQRRNELAYQAWLECKKQEYLEQKAKEKSVRPVTSVTRDEEAKRRVAFENWLIRKQEEKQNESDSKHRVREQEEVAAQKADPTIVAQAYKSWLHRKKAQARDEAVKKEQYRKKYYRQSRQLKQSASLRFEGF